ncbi:MAG: cytochrome bd ubiquinol oxidase, subunit [Conexibacter sp.]|jgi:cytochrome d ubiquinol oxidase subunit I|nr:cytochrome bd ubiquinol oxidase, subunit [Conexibacter sp.]
MTDHVLIDRLQFTLAVTFHYLFPVLTMGLALFIAWLKTSAYLGRGGEDAERAARFWAKIFGLTFAVGVVTGIPLEFQFGTNWAAFSRYAGGVIGTTLAMEGVFAFFAESVFLGVFLWGRGRVSPRVHWISSLLVLVGSWLSGFFIIATNAWMQHPVGYAVNGDRLRLSSIWQLLTNPWLPWQYAHNMSGAAVTGAFALAAVGALYLLLDRHHEVARMCVRIGVIGALIFSVLQIFPTGDRSAHNVAHMQPPAFAAMEGMFQSERGAPLVIIGNPNTEQRRLESTIELPHVLSFLTSRNWNEQLTGLDAIPQDRWPNSVALVYYAYHIMVGLGTLFVVLAGIALLLLRRGRLYRSTRTLWALMIAFPLTYVANIAGWAVAETGRQPWVVYGLQRTRAGASPAESVPSGTALFSLLGFAGLYLLVGILYVVLVLRVFARGPVETGLKTTTAAR